MNLTCLTPQPTQKDGNARLRRVAAIFGERMRLQYCVIGDVYRIIRGGFIKPAMLCETGSTFSPVPLLARFMLLMTLPFATGFNAAYAQSALESGEVAPMGNWLQYRDVAYSGAPILLHLRTGYERAIILPETVVQSDDQGTLTGAEIAVDGRIVTFYPTQTFGRQSVIFIGEDSGTKYEFRIRASTAGLRQPLRLLR